MLAEAEQPEDWDEDEDGEWEPPRVPNSACETAPGCGEWKRPTKLNPDYKGPWYPPMIDNPEYKVSLSESLPCAVAAIDCPVAPRIHVSYLIMVA